jgi:uncharacterized protein YdcH (DUF465 family)
MSPDLDGNLRNHLPKYNNVGHMIQGKKDNKKKLKKCKWLKMKKYWPFKDEVQTALFKDPVRTAQ